MYIYICLYSYIHIYSFTYIHIYRVPPNIPQLTSQKVLNEQCGENGDGGGKICVIMFLPHIYDSNSKQRQIYIDTLVKIASTFRGTFSFLWSEGTAHQV
jgi:hypothetical protein